MAEKASVENRPMAPITIRAPAYQSRCARSKRGAGATADGAARLVRKLSNGFSRSASSAPALTAARRSCAVKCMKILHGSPGERDARAAGAGKFRQPAYTWLRAADRHHSLPQTDGWFDLRGRIAGLDVNSR